MSEIIKSDWHLDKEAESYARDIFDTFKDENGGAAFDAELFSDDMRESAWEYAGNSEHVIYTARAIAICGNCNTDSGEEWLEGGSNDGKPFGDCDTFADVCTKLAFAELLCRIESKLQELIDEWEPIEPESDDAGAA